MSTAIERTAITLLVRGRVQGVGFRPFVVRLARRLGVFGRVANTSAGVRIRAEGTSASLRRFCDQLPREAPPAARIDTLDVQAASAALFATFEIEASEPLAEVGVRVPRDLATCEHCRLEVFDPGDRRADYPLTNCTNCGPRYSILEALPYDRRTTSMRYFDLCASCRTEYQDPEDRRFHAEPIACPTCGPRVSLVDGQGRVSVAGLEAVGAAAALIRSGGLLALKGLGGYQLACRAAAPEAVARLRRLKGRPSKPLAVMLRSIDEAERLARVGPLERSLLSASENPIVLLTKRADAEAQAIDPQVAPRVATLGVLLPTTPLHHLLLAAVDAPIVATSGNRGEEPIVIDDEVAIDKLSEIADAVLLHDRPITRRLDDSVVRVMGEFPVTIRSARGFAPLPLPAVERMATSSRRIERVRPVLAVGGHQKVALALWNGEQAVLGPHIGDLDTPASRSAFERAARDLATLYGCEPATIVCDQHPDYATSRWAGESGRPLLIVQHHHAHAVAAMVEHDLLDREVLALAWDGTGWGTDGTIWGGEALRARVDTFSRLGSLMSFALPGGEAAVRQPRRAAFAVLAAALGEQAILDDHALLERIGVSKHEATVWIGMINRNVQAPRTSSVGRLFDAVACLLLGAGEVSYEGEAAVWLESAADPGAEAGAPIVNRSEPDGGLERGDWRPMIAELVADLRRGETEARLAGRFHRTLAEWAAETARRAALPDVVLCGGCFQNCVLTEAVTAASRQAGCRVYGPGAIPTNDGGLAAGQLTIGLALLLRQTHETDAAGSSATGLKTVGIEPSREAD